ncbi:hypothetical protein WA026_010954 [Henosepilachna vigintioctopunctata]|uniref:Partner of Y14 and mago n=1 Tax=Henosepilachna vigintioctopunctata TaxID=420089 RepID=A0AAW1UX40_9CUCU
MFSPTNIVSDNGDSFIPASQRPDGTWRKARRVKEGYVPQEEVPLYESKGKQFMSKATQPQTVVLASGQVAHQTIPGLFIVDKKEKKATKKPKKVPEEKDICLKLQNTTISSHKNTSPKENKKQDKKIVSEVEEPSTEKKIKNLKKKVREIEALEEKLKNGTIAKPEPEQLQKVKRKNDLLMQIHELEKLL